MQRASHRRLLSSAVLRKSPLLPSKQLAKSYDPSMVEAGRYEWWDQKGLFKPLPQDQTVEKFTMILPPPNVTGDLHIGHALTCYIQDAIARWRRMLGHSVQWIPGTDHAGIATQTVVERRILSESKLTRYDLGREEFLRRVWEFRDKHGDQILKQMRRMGAGLDWSQTFFTLDPSRTQFVTDTFIKLHDEGLIYRDNRLVNWCCTLRTAISDIEVEYLELEGKSKISIPDKNGGKRQVEVGILDSFAYPVVDVNNGHYTGEHLVVSTTRLETIIGDTAVAIHPEDERYKKYQKGFQARNPITGRLIPIISDRQLVDPEFGTGVVKVTPAHDFNDFQCGKTHGLPIVDVFEKDGTISSQFAELGLAGMDRYNARTHIRQRLVDAGLYRGQQSHRMRIALCSRSGDIVEPIIQPQWYLKCTDMAANVLRLTETGQLIIRPSAFQNQWIRWLESCQDWCLSRQIWWGHQIPMYRIIIAAGDQERWVAASSLDEARLKAEKLVGDWNCEIKIEQDHDVLDTWFSSALLPLSATAHDPSRYPTNMIESGSDILFFWVAKMAMLCNHLSGKPPFKEINLHAMVRDSQGRKMSKSLGNVIDPLYLIDGASQEKMESTLRSGNLPKDELNRGLKLLRKEFPDGINANGSDALRFALLEHSQQTRQINLNPRRVTTSRHFGNKIWNLFRFSFNHFDQHGFPIDSSPRPRSSVKPRLLINRFILSRLLFATKACNAGFESYELHEGVSALNKFVVGEICDVFLELSKRVLNNPLAAAVEERQKQDIAETLETLHLCLDSSLRLLHPFMPYLTEYLWQSLNLYSSKNHALHDDVSIMVQNYPAENQLTSFYDPNAENDMQMLMETIHAIRSLKKEQNVQRECPALFVDCKADDEGITAAQLFRQHAADLAFICKAPVVNVVNGSTDPDLFATRSVSGSISVALRLDQLAVAPIHDSTNRSRVEKKLAKLNELHFRLESEINHPQTPLNVKEIKRQQYLKCLEEIKELKGK